MAQMVKMKLKCLELACRRYKAKSLQRREKQRNAIIYSFSLNQYHQMPAILCLNLFYFILDYSKMGSNISHFQKNNISLMGQATIFSFQHVSLKRIINWFLQNAGLQNYCVTLVKQIFIRLTNFIVMYSDFWKLVLFFSCVKVETFFEELIIDFQIFSYDYII